MPGIRQRTLQQHLSETPVSRSPTGTPARGPSSPTAPPPDAYDRLQLRQVRKPEPTEVLQNLATTPVPLSALDPPAKFAVWEKVPPTLRSALSDAPHPGLSNPFDVRKLIGADVRKQAALAKYLNADFVRGHPEAKQKILKQIEDLLLPGKIGELSQFHLPQCAGGSPSMPISYGLEAECPTVTKRTVGAEGGSGVLDLYGPSPTGALHPKGLSDEMLTQIKPPPGVNKLVWTRMPLERRRTWVAERQTWSDLTPQEKIMYMRTLVDVDDTPRMFPQPQSIPSIPESLRQSEWEGVPPRLLEVVGQPHRSLDQVYGDIHFLENAGTRPKFHVHHVVKVPQEKQAEVGPQLLALAALQDLALFGRSVAKGGHGWLQTVLKPWSASQIQQATRQLQTGHELYNDEHKYHGVGLRAIYDHSGERLGLELRGVPRGDSEHLMETSRRMSQLLASDSWLRLPTPPWKGWDAQDTDVVIRAEAAARAELPEEENTAAQVSFFHILNMADRNDGYHVPLFESPWWNYEGLPGITDEDATRIARARSEFNATLLQLSRTMTASGKALRNLYSENREGPTALRDTLTQALRRFHAAADVEGCVDRLFDSLADGGRS